MKPFYLLCLFGLGMSLQGMQAQPDCQNVTQPGTICCDDTICAGDPMPLLAQISAPDGGAGALEFVWDVMHVVPGESPVWEPIPGATEADFQVNNLEAGRYFFIRAARRVGCAAFVSGNFVEINVFPANSQECSAVATSAPGSTELRPYQLNTHTAAISNTTSSELVVLVWDLTGRLLARFEIAGNDQAVVPVSGVSKGILLVHVQDLFGNTWLEKLTHF